MRSQHDYMLSVLSQRKEDEISFDCGIFCHLFFLENQEGQKDEPTKEE